MKRWLRIIRVVFQSVIFLILTWAVAAAPTIITERLQGEIERWQLIPMTVLGTMHIVGVWLVVTLVFGRVYCSTVCPVGTLQDMAARMRRVRKGAYIYHYKPGVSWVVRIAMLAILVLTVLFVSYGISWTVMPFIQVSPYDSYDSIITNIFKPLAEFIARDHTTPVGLRFALTAVINLVFILGMGYMRGRDLCNSLCPVGTALSYVNAMSLFHIDIDTDRCTHCRRCEYVCKSSCVNSETGAVDLSRCVVCFDCLSVCKDDAISYTTRRHRLSTPMFQSIRTAKPALNLDVSQTYVKQNIDKKQNIDETVS